MKPLIEGVTPTKEALGLPVAWVCDERSVGSYTQDRRTCDACKHYAQSESFYKHLKNHGFCSLLQCSSLVFDADKISASCEAGGAWLAIGPKFGCIHWEKKS